jgi:hypothetical protein
MSLFCDIQANQLDPDDLRSMLAGKEWKKRKQLAGPGATSATGAQVNRSKEMDEEDDIDEACKGN